MGSSVPADDGYGARGGVEMAHELFAPAQLGPATLRNRIIKAATFEGMSPKNVVSRSLTEFHRRMAAGGVGMTTVSYVAVAPGGMGAPNEIYVHDGAAEGLARIAEVVHAEGAAISAQLGHAGAVGDLPGKVLLGPSKARTLTGGVVHEIRPGQIDEVVAQFTAGAKMLADAGFDACELHFGHHYLISAFLSPKWNRRTDEYDGRTAEGRTLLARRILRDVRQAVGNRIAVTAKLNMVDAVRGGLTVEQSIENAKLLEAEGVLDAIQLTGGGSQRNQMFMFRGGAPRAEMAQLLQKPVQKFGFKVLGRWLLKEYPFEEAYFLPMARQFKAALSTPITLLGGINRLDTMQAAMAEGFSFVAVGRALVRDPDLINKLRDGTVAEGNCIHCNKCMLSIYTGTRCVLDQPQPVRLG